MWSMMPRQCHWYTLLSNKCSYSIAVIECSIKARHTMCSMNKTYICANRSTAVWRFIIDFKTHDYQCYTYHVLQCWRLDWSHNGYYTCISIGSSTWNIYSSSSSLSLTLSLSLYLYLFISIAISLSLFLSFLFFYFYLSLTLSLSLSLSLFLIISISFMLISHVLENHTYNIW